MIVLFSLISIALVVYLLMPATPADLTTLSDGLTTGGCDSRAAASKNKENDERAIHADHRSRLQHADPLQQGRRCRALAGRE